MTGTGFKRPVPDARGGGIAKTRYFPRIANRGRYNAMNKPGWTLQVESVAFAPSEAAVATLLSTTMQRDWRLRGFLPKSEKHARFDVFDLAKLRVMKLFSDKGIGPKASSEAAEEISRRVVQQIAFLEGSYEAERLSHFEQLPDDFRPRPYELEKVTGPDSERRLLQHCQNTWQTNEVLWKFGLDEQSDSFIRVAIENGVCLIKDEDPTQRPSELIEGPFLLMSARLLAEELLNRIGGPVFLIHFHGEPFE